jgi:hypothetical protein
VIEQTDASVKNDALEQLQRFYKEKIEQGAVIRKGYTLPPLDTVGREAYVSLLIGRSTQSK